MRRRWIIILLASLLVDAFIGWWWFVERREHRYDLQILTAARRYQLEPALVKAVVWRESLFNASARGSAGEIGLMQIREPAAREWATAEKVGGFGMGQLYNPSVNTMAGSWYLARLVKRYGQTDDPWAYALADYNAGRTHVLRWIQGPARTNSTQFLAQMDFPGTRKYVRTILERRAYYRVKWNVAEN